MPIYPFKDFAGTSHTILIRLIQRWSPPGGRLLDLGAFGGELGEAVRDHFGKTIAYEYVLENIGSLHSRFDSVVMTDLEGIRTIPPRPDAVVLADVLEHLKWPEPLLRMAAAAVTEEGRVFISLPNVANVAIRLALLAGRFEYGDRGILDRTHVRFYTRKTAREEIGRAGLEILHEEASTIPVRYVLTRAPRPIVAAAEILLALLTRLWPTLFGYQFVFVTRRKQAEPE